MITTNIIIFFNIGPNGQPPQMFISPHVALLAKTLDTPVLRGLVTFKHVMPLNVFWNKFHASNYLTGKKEGKSSNESMKLTLNDTFQYNKALREMHIKTVTTNTWKANLNECLIFFSWHKSTP